MEWIQIAAWVAWAWVALTTTFACMSVYELIILDDGSSDFEKTPSLATAMALNAILGLMLIQTLGLTV